MVVLFSSIHAVTYSCFHDKIKMLIKNESLKYLRYNAVGHSPAVLIPARSVLATVVGFVSQFTVNK